MTVEERKVIEKYVYEKRQEIKEKKMLSYAGKNKDVLANFKRNAERWGITKYQVWAIYFGKHIDSIANAIIDNPERPIDSSENMEGRIYDLENYLDILADLLAEDGLIEVPEYSFATKTQVTSGRLRPIEALLTGQLKGPLL